ncbi:MAG: DUF1553 domain-containing protein [Planctomycetota bacterium]
MRITEKRRPAGERLPLSCCIWLVGLLQITATSKALAHDPGSVEFFEAKIRPILVDRCYGCHSGEADETGGTLWLDSADAMLTGGDSGPAIKPGDAEQSLLISALRYESSEMPPDAPLPAEVINDFVRWIDAGAKDPRQEAGVGPVREKIDLEAGRTFWSFRPLSDFRKHVESSGEPSGGYDAARLTKDGLIDHVVDHRLSDAGILPNPPAGLETRLRRLAFDLTGLPPSVEIQEQWQRSPTRETWIQIVDQLLESRSFAQHWARHWMDVARYADSNGSDFNATFHDAWRYRDYLVDSFDQDRPFDEMIRQQVAGDLLPWKTDQQRHDNLVATTFLMLGTKMLSERDKAKLTLDVVDEQIDTVGRSFLGLTLGCARCHDHKFDPIPTEDYYALAGIFRSTQTLNGESQQFVSTFNRTPLPAPPELAEAHREHKAAIKDLKEKIAESRRSLEDLEREQPAGIVIDDADAKKLGAWKSSTYTKGFIGKGYVHDENANKGERSIEFRTRLPESGSYRVRMAFSSAGNRASNVPVAVHAADAVSKHLVNQQAKPASAPWHELGAFEFSGEVDAVVRITNEATDGYVIADAVQFIHESVETTQSKPSGHEAAVAQLKSEIKQQEVVLKALEQTAPEPLPFAMAPRDFSKEKIGDSPVHIRGEVRNTGDIIPRGFLRVFGTEAFGSDADAESVSSHSAMFSTTITNPQGSGRLELANWLTDPDHPLVSRVIVNRVWSHLFGEGLVRSVDNFGQRGELPSHPELLDALAIDFMRDGWHFKKLIRSIVLTDAYSRSSSFSKESSELDPENRLLWRANRKRITAESIRDSMLVAAGMLSVEEPSAPVADKDVLATKNNGDSKAATTGLDARVRTLYLPIIRSNVSPLLTSLDAADPDLLVGKRPTTNVPGQALVLLNSPDVIRWADHAADRIAAVHDSDYERLVASFRICLSRTPTADELEMAGHFSGLDASEKTAAVDVGEEMNRRERLRDWVAAIFASTEFRFLD